MTIPELRERMRGWLAGDYETAIFLVNAEPVAYALLRLSDGKICLRQFFVRRDRRRAGLGHAAMDLLRRRIWPRDKRVTVDVLCRNKSGIDFWRSAGYADYCVTLEMAP